MRKKREAVQKRGKSAPAGKVEPVGIHPGSLADSAVHSIEGTEGGGHGGPALSSCREQTERLGSDQEPRNRAALRGEGRSRECI